MPELVGTYIPTYCELTLKTLLSRIRPALKTSLMVFGLAIAGISFAQEEVNENLARMGGHAQAMGELCAGMTKTDAEARRKEQAVAMAKRGMTAARFDKLFQEGYASSKTKIDAASPQQREEGCKQLMSGGKKR